MSNSEIKLKAVTPIFRIFDVERAKDFYLNFLEFQLDGEHRFEPDSPVYLFISYGSCTIHLSEHHGDGSPGAAVRIEVENIKELHSRLINKKYKYLRPGLEKTPWNSEEVHVIDPFGNRIHFYQGL